MSVPDYEAAELANELAIANAQVRWMEAEIERLRIKIVAERKRCRERVGAERDRWAKRVLVERAADQQLRLRDIERLCPEAAAEIKRLKGEVVLFTELQRASNKEIERLQAELVAERERWVSPEAIEAGARALVPFCYGAFEWQTLPDGTRVQPPLQPNAFAAQAAKAVLDSAATIRKGE